MLLSPPAGVSRRDHTANGVVVPPAPAASPTLQGNDNVYTSYAGIGGIPLDSFWRRVLFAWTQKDINILRATHLMPDSRLQGFILGAYERAIPGEFRSLDQLSPDLKAHLRYPEGLFAIQSDEHKTFP
jgi:uncharacterized membrane protein (UPF0182 family)